MARSKLPDYKNIVTQDPVEPIYLLYGAEDFLRTDALNMLLERIIDPATRDFNFEMFHADDISGDTVYTSALNCPMMSDRRIILVKNADKLLGEQAALSRYLEQPTDTTVLIFEAPKIDARGKFFKKLKKAAVCLEFQQLKLWQIPAWLRQHAKAQQISLSDDGADALVELTGTNLRAIVTELEKTWLYMGETGTINRGAVLDTVGASRDHNVFEWNKAVGNRDISKAVTIAHAMLHQGERPTGMIVMLARHLSKLYKMRIGQRAGATGAELAKQVGVHYAFLNETSQQAKKFTPRQIYQAFEALLEADTTLKSSSRDHFTVIDILLYRILSTK